MPPIQLSYADVSIDNVNRAELERHPPPRNYLILLVSKNSAFKVVIGSKKIVLTPFLYSL